MTRGAVAGSFLCDRGHELRIPARQKPAFLTRQQKLLFTRSCVNRYVGLSTCPCFASTRIFWPTARGRCSTRCSWKYAAANAYVSTAATQRDFCCCCGCSLV